MGKITCFGLGEKGVNLVKSPLHLEDGELTNAQNAEFFRNQGRGGIRKRSGLARFNQSALGAIRRFLNVPLPATPTTTLLASVEGAATETWVISTDGGTTWAEATSPPRSFTYAKSTRVNYLGVGGRIASLDGRIYYPSDAFIQYPTASHQPPPIMFYDGSVSGEVCQVPNNPTVGAATNAKNVEAMATLNGTVYLTTYDGQSGTPRDCGRVFNLDVRTGTLNQIGPSFGDGTGDTDPGAGLRPLSLGWCAGRLWVGMLNDSGSASGAKIYSIRPGIDEAWTLEHTGDASEVIVTSMVEYQGLLYASFAALGAVVAKVKKRQQSDGLFVASDSQAKGVAGAAYYSGLVVHGADLYAGYTKTGTDARIRKFNGAAWSTDRDEPVLLPTVHESISVGGALYFVVNSGVASTGVLRKSIAGVWAVVANFSTVVGSANGVIGYTVL